MARSRCALIIAIGIVLIVLAATPPRVMGQDGCIGKYKGGVIPSPVELEAILKKHAEWVKDGGPESDSSLYDTAHILRSAQSGLFSPRIQ
jgi:hypothetical protein